jgi:putative ABC transport system permease protein
MILFIPSTVAKTLRSFTLALRSLWLHKMRAFLSVLGIIIGTGAVIALMAFGEGSMQDALEDIKSQGASNIIVRSEKPSEDGTTTQRSFVASYGLTTLDCEYLRSLPTVVRYVPLRVFKQEVRYLEHSTDGRVVGTTPLYKEVHKFDIVSGRFLTDEEEEKMWNHAVLGSDLAARLFPFEDPLGKAVLIGRYHYQVVGVLGSRMPTGGSGGSQAAENFNNDVYIPLSTCNVRFGERVFVRQTGSRMGERVALHQITLTVNDIDKVRATGDLVRDWLQRTHPSRRKDWVVTVPLDRLEQAEREKTRFTRLLVMIGGISLFVGGIGIMNIMLATVTERTREIGIRRALGAKRRDITMQFLIEAIVQTTIGGFVGVLLGLSVVFLAPVVAKVVFEANLPAKVHVPSIFLALFFSVGVGVGFGLYPALRASHLDPIEALRHV